jgi:hypothetical protein
MSEDNFEIVLVDVAEMPIERPKKNKEGIIQERKKTHYKDTSSSR